jgi:hypothetical protein
VTYADLICPSCRKPPRDVVPAYFDRDGELLPYPSDSALLWTCQGGHRHITGNRNPDGGLEHMAVAP